MANFIFTTQGPITYEAVSEVTGISIDDLKKANGNKPLNKSVKIPYSGIYKDRTEIENKLMSNPEKLAARPVLAHYTEKSKSTLLVLQELHQKTQKAKKELDNLIPSIIKPEDREAYIIENNLLDKLEDTSKKYLSAASEEASHYYKNTDANGSFTNVTINENDYLNWIKIKGNEHKSRTDFQKYLLKEHKGNVRFKKDIYDSITNTAATTARTVASIYTGGASELLLQGATLGNLWFGNNDSKEIMNRFLDSSNLSNLNFVSNVLGYNNAFTNTINTGLNFMLGSGMNPGGFASGVLFNLSDEAGKKLDINPETRFVLNNIATALTDPKHIIKNSVDEGLKGYTINKISDLSNNEEDKEKIRQSLMFGTMAAKPFVKNQLHKTANRARIVAISLTQGSPTNGIKNVLHFIKTGEDASGRKFSRMNILKYIAGGNREYLTDAKNEYGLTGYWGYSDSPYGVDPDTGIGYLHTIDDKITLPEITYGTEKVVPGQEIAGGVVIGSDIILPNRLTAYSRNNFDEPAVVISRSKENGDKAVSILDKADKEGRLMGASQDAQKKITGEGYSHNRGDNVVKNTDPILQGTFEESLRELGDKIFEEGLTQEEAQTLKDLEYWTTYGVRPGAYHQFNTGGILPLLIKGKRGGISIIDTDNFKHKPDEFNSKYNGAGSFLKKLIKHEVTKVGLGGEEREAIILGTPRSVTYRDYVNLVSKEVMDELKKKEDPSYQPSKIKITSDELLSKYGESRSFQTSKLIGNNLVRYIRTHAGLKSGKVGGIPSSKVVKLIVDKIEKTQVK